jgi:hypothetical protein
MKLPHRSLAYVVGKRRLRGTDPWWTPIVFLAAAMYCFAQAYRRRGPVEIQPFVGTLFLLAAYLAWLQRGMQEAYRELELRLESDRSASRDA